MNKRFTVLACSTTIALIATLAGCSAGVDGTSGAPEGTAAAPAVTESIHEPTPLYTIQLENGHTVEFHDFGSGVGIMERGPAGATAPQVHRIPGQPDTLTSLYASVAPGKPLPPELAVVEQRILGNALMSPPTVRGLDGEHRTVSAPSVSSGGEAAATTTSGGKIHPEWNNWCGNECCDWNWVHNTMCTATDQFTWFNFNYGWSVENGTNMSNWDTHVCAAWGTSNFQTIVDGGFSANWNVVQGNWANFIWWDHNWLGEKNVFSNVNNSVYQATHTYCGAAS